MILREFGVESGYLLNLQVRYGRCPFHTDYKPSAYWNSNNIYCFTCSKTFSFSEIRHRLGVQITWEEENLIPPALSFEKAYGYKPFQVLFQYDFSQEKLL